VLLAFSRAVQAGVGTMLAVWGVRLSAATWNIPMAGLSLPQGAAYVPLSVGGLLIAAFALNLLLRAPDIRAEGG
jgi:TRAP-type C4-dicarboxylate transport system permease small subunit